MTTGDKLTYSYIVTVRDQPKVEPMAPNRFVSNRTVTAPESGGPILGESRAPGLHVKEHQFIHEPVFRESGEHDVVNWLE